MRTLFTLLRIFRLWRYDIKSSQKIRAKIFEISELIGRITYPNQNTGRDDCLNILAQNDSIFKVIFKEFGFLRAKMRRRRKLHLDNHHYSPKIKEIEDVIVNYPKIVKELRKRG